MTDSEIIWLVFYTFPEHVVTEIGEYSFSALIKHSLFTPALYYSRPDMDTIEFPLRGDYELVSDFTSSLEPTFGRWTRERPRREIHIRNYKRIVPSSLPERVAVVMVQWPINGKSRGQRKLEHIMDQLYDMPSDPDEWLDMDYENNE